MVRKYSLGKVWYSANLSPCDLINLSEHGNFSLPSSVSKIRVSYGI